MQLQQHRDWPRTQRTTSLAAKFLILCVPVAVASRATCADGADLPKFLSLKSDPVNLRKGPGIQFPKAWIFRRAGLPIEVLRQHGRWRQIRDSDGATGWVLRTLISRRRTALVQPWVLQEKSAGAANLTSMRRSARRRSRIVAQLEPGTLVSLKSCDGTWCQVSIDRFRGYVRQDKLWGVYPKETVR